MQTLQSRPCNVQNVQCHFEDITPHTLTHPHHLFIKLELLQAHRARVFRINLLLGDFLKRESFHHVWVCSRCAVSTTIIHEIRYTAEKKHEEICRRVFLVLPGARMDTRPKDVSCIGPLEALRSVVGLAKDGSQEIDWKIHQDGSFVVFDGG